MTAAIGSVAAGAGAIGWASGAIQAPATTSAAAMVPAVTGDPRVDTLLARMSLTDKLRLLTWASGQSQTAVLPGLRRLGIPALHLAEGPLGTAAHPAPAMTSPLAVAATFSQADANAVGMMIGRDARALGQQAVARPFAALGWSRADDPAASFGEDPLLAGRIAAAEIAGIQAQGTMAVVRGYLSGPAGTGLLTDSQALHELYLQPVEAAVRAGAAGVLCAPGTLGVAGTSQATRPPAQPACGDASLLSQILRRELGFGGFTVADQGASPGMVSLDSGLDGQILPPSRSPSFTPAAVRAAIADGTVGLATVNQAVGAVLAQLDRFGLLGHAAKHTTGREPASADERAVARTGEDAATLLKNAGQALPLSPARLGSLALIGPGAAQVIGADPEGGNGTGIPSRRPGTLQVLRQDLAGNPAAHLSYAVGDDMTGTPVPASALSHDGQPGLVRITAGTSAGTGTTQVVRTLDDSLAHGGALPAGSAHTWSGELTVPATGDYWINLATGGARATVTVDGSVVAQNQPGGSLGGALLPTTDGLDNLRASLPLTAGTHTLSVSQIPDGSGRPVQVRLDWVTPAQQQANESAAVAVARNAKAAVVFAWSGPTGDTGTSQATTPGGGPGNTAGALPDGQDQLIRDVAAANPDTIVVLNTPGPVGMPWLGDVRAVLEMWYPGDAGGSATANVLLGRADPAGRLPVTWPVIPGQSAPARPPGVLAGYRWYDRQGVTPMFAFGYGLSYTHFRYSGLTWRPSASGGLTVRFRVTNAGRLAGQEVPQVYLGAPATRPQAAAFPPKALAAFTRVSLRPGQTRAVTLHVPRRQLQYWDDSRGWVTAPGQRRLDVGPNERASALSATVTIPG